MNIRQKGLTLTEVWILLLAIALMALLVTASINGGNGIPCGGVK